MAKSKDQEKTAGSSPEAGTRLVTAKGCVLVRYLGPPAEGQNALLGRRVVAGEVFTVTDKQAARLLHEKQPFELAYEDDQTRIEALSKELNTTAQA